MSYPVLEGRQKARGDQLFICLGDLQTVRGEEDREGGEGYEEGMEKEKGSGEETRGRMGEEKGGRGREYIV
jgi:hypothetical protein